MIESDAAYFSRRADEERAAADKAAGEEARHAHLEMAERYDALARSIAGHESAVALKIVN